MHKEIIINSSPNEARVALLEDHEVVEFMMERSDNKRAVGNVYKGVVTAVRPGLQAAFVDIGMEKGGFLHVSDLVHDDPVDDDDGRGRGRGRGRRREGLRPIETMLKEGDEILVQVTKEVIGTKGPRLTADISLPGRFMVLMPKGDHVGVSRKIDDRKERSRLKGILSDLKPDDEAGAFIIRTAAIDQDAKMVERDMQYLRDLWKQINQTAHSVQAPAVVHEDVGLIVSLIRDIFKNDVDSVVIDSRDEHQRLMQYVKTFSPDLRDRITFYDGDLPIFDKYGIEAELKKSLDKKVWMKRGGFLVIEQTEALVAIDVNTGRFIGKKNQAETIFKTNMVAAKEIARQLRLRDVGGIIVLDFIDMDSEDDKRKVLAELRQHLKRDRSRTKTFAVSDLGLIEMSRQRVQESLKDRLSDNCPYCNGSGQILSVDTLANKVERLLAKLAATRNEKSVQVRANPTLALQLMTERANTFQQIERSTGLQIDVVDDARLHREEFQIVSLSRRKDLVAEIEKSDGSARGGEERPSRGDSDRGARRGGRDRDQDDSGDRDGGRRRRRRRDEDDAPRERDRDRGRRTRSRDDAGSTDEERRPRRGREEGPREERPRRRGRDDARREEPARGEAKPESRGSTGSSAQGSTSEGHPAEQGGEDRPRRRRRRGRRGGRGRRRGSRGDDATESRSEATEQQETHESKRTPRSARRSDDRETKRAESPAPREVEDTSDDRGPEREDTRRRDDERSAPEERPAAEEREAAVADGDDNGHDDAPRERRRRRRGGRGRRANGSESTETTETTAQERPSTGESRESEAETTSDASAPTASRDEETSAPRAEGARSRSRSRSGRGSGRASEPAREPVRDDRSDGPDGPKSGEIDSKESYVGPVPEGSTEPTPRKDSESDKEPAEARERAGRSTSGDPEDSAGEGSDSDDRSRRRRRRRRARSAGTPTRLIGTGKTKDQDD